MTLGPSQSRPLPESREFSLAEQIGTGFRPSLRSPPAARASDFADERLSPPSRADAALGHVFSRSPRSAGAWT